MEREDTAVATVRASDVSVNNVDEPRAKPLPRPPVTAELITFDRILRAVCAEFRVTHAQIMGKERYEHIIHARHVAMYVTRVMLAWSYPWIGRCFQNKDHTTAMHAVNKIGRFVSKDPAWAQTIARVKARVETARTIAAPTTREPLFPPVPGLFEAEPDAP